MYLVIAHVMVFMKYVTEAKGGERTQFAEARYDRSLWTNETSRNESSFLQYLPLFWSVRQSAAVEPKLSLSQNTTIS